MKRPRHNFSEEGNQAGSRAAAGRARRALWDEISQLRPRVHAAQGISKALPQLCFNRIRTELYRAAGIEIGEGSLLMGHVTLTGLGNWSDLLHIGRRTYITGPLRIDLGGAVHIGDDVNIGHDCVILTVDHEIGSRQRRAGATAYGSVAIGDGAWLASRVVVLPGRAVGAGAVVASGAVVTADVEPHTLVAGVPARRIRRLDET